MWKTPETSKEVNCAERSGRAVCISYYALTFHWGQFVVFGLIFNEAKKASHILGCKHLIKAFQEHNTNVEQRGFLFSSSLNTGFAISWHHHKANMTNFSEISGHICKNGLGRDGVSVCACICLSSRRGIVLLVLWKHAVTRHSSSEQPSPPPSVWLMRLILSINEETPVD